MLSALSVFARFVFVLVPETINFADVASSREGTNLVLVDVVHQLRELVLVEESFELDALLAAVAANDLIHSASALQVVDDVLA